MLAAVLKGVDKLVLEDVPVPEPQAGEVLVRVKACGFCATDYKAIRGIRTNVSFPCILGHEPAGVVAAVGPGVDAFREGEEVIVAPSGYCGFCQHCRSGREHYCRSAFTTGGDGPTEVWPGAFAQYLRTRATCLYPKPAAISWDAAAITEPLSGAWKGIIGYSQLEVGETVVIIGAGSIGLLCLLVAKAAGAGRIVAVDTRDYALRKAREVGATDTVQPGAEEAKRRVYEILPEGPDLVVEAAGTIAAVRLMVDLRRRGTRWNLFGITTPERFELDGGRTHFLEGRLDASFGTNPLAMTRAIRLMERGLVRPESTVLHRFALAEIPRAVEVMASEERTKVLILP